jgi:hypothetical protein
MFKVCCIVVWTMCIMEIRGTLYKLGALDAMEVEHKVKFLFLLS